MRSPLKLLTVVCSLPVLVFGSALLADYVHSRSLIYPSLANQSSFLTSYRPDTVLDPYLSNQSYSTIGAVGGSFGGSAGERSVTHQSERGFFFVARRKDQATLQTEIYNDILAELQNNNARALGQCGDLKSGVQISYQAGNSVGVVNLLPFIPDTGVRRHYTLPASLQDTAFRIRINETWYASASDIPAHAAHTCAPPHPICPGVRTPVAPSESEELICYRASLRTPCIPTTGKSDTTEQRTLSLECPVNTSQSSARTSSPISTPVKLSSTP